MKKLILSALLLAGLSSSAFAAASMGSLILGFRDASVTNSLTINLGLKSDVVANASAAGGTIDLGDYSAALTGAFGAGWSTDPVLWGVAGTMNNASKELFISAAASGSSFDGVTPASTAWLVKSTTTQQLVNTKVQTIYNNTASNAGESLQNTGNNSVSWSFIVQPNNALVAFGQYQKSLFEAQGASYADLYDLNNPGNTNTGASGVFFGTVQVRADGHVLFSTAGAAIPEPSTYAGLLGVATLGIVALRRRRQAVQA